MKPNIQKLADYINQQKEPERFMEVLLALAEPKNDCTIYSHGITAQGGTHT